VSQDTAQQATGAEDRYAPGRLLLRVGRSSFPWIAVLAVAMLALAAAELAFPAVLGRAVDAVVGAGASKSWLIWAGLLVAVRVASDGLGVLAAGAATARSTAWLRRAVLGAVLALGTRAAGRFTPGDLASRLVGNAAEAGRLTTNVVQFGADVIPALGAIVALALIDPWLCVTFLIGLPVLILLARAFVRDISGLARRYFDVQATIAARLVDALSGARTIAAARTADREAERILAPLPDLHEHGMGMWRAQGRITAQDALLVPMLEVAVLAVAGAELSRGRITPGELLAASQYVLLGTSLGSAVSSLSRLIRAGAAAERGPE
jgi:ATP-binding cassette subfamily B protein